MKEMSVQVGEETVTISQPQFLSSTIDRGLYETIMATETKTWQNKRFHGQSNCSARAF